MKPFSNYFLIFLIHSSTRPTVWVIVLDELDDNSPRNMPVPCRKTNTAMPSTSFNAVEEIDVEVPNSRSLLHLSGNYIYNFVFVL